MSSQCLIHTLTLPHSVLGDDRLIMSRPVDGYDPLWLKYRHVHSTCCSTP